MTDRVFYFLTEGNWIDWNFGFGILGTLKLIERIICYLWLLFFFVMFIIIKVTSIVLQPRDYYYYKKTFLILI